MKNRFFILTALFCIGASSLFGAESRALSQDARADEAYRAKNYFTAIEYYKAALQENPHYVDALYGLSLTYFTLNEYTEALKYISRARKIDVHDTSLMVLEGRIYTALGKFSEALKTFKYSLVKEPNNTEAELGLAELYVAEGDVLDAVGIYSKTLRYLPDDRRTLLSLIVILDKEGKFREADKYVSHILRLYPNNSVVQYTAAEHYILEGKTDQIEAHAAAAVALDGKNQKAVLLLTQLYIRQKHYAEAAVLLQKVLKIQRDEPLVWYMLGEVYRLEKNTASALQSYAIAVALDGNDELLRMALENFVIENTSPDSLMREKYARYHFNNGRELEERNYLSKAREEYRRGLLIAPHSDTGWLLYAHLLKQSGYMSRYLSILEEVAKDKPHDTELQDKIEIYKSLLVNTVASRWKIDQFAIAKSVTAVGIYSSKQDSSSHFNAGYYINRSLRNLLQGSERITIAGIGENLDFADAFNDARKNNCTYFLMLSSAEDSHTFSVHVKLFHGKTGALLREFSLYRTGNNRITSALSRVSDTVISMIPLQGKILKMKFDTALVNIGLSDGIKKGDTFFIANNFVYPVDKAHLLGEIKITGVDDLVSEGTVKKYTFFNLINPGDAVVPDKKHDTPSGKGTTVQTQSPPSGDMYKTIRTLP